MTTPKRGYVLSLSILMIAAFLPASARPAAGQERLRGYEYLNQIRKAAGLAPFERERKLEKAAQGHADYLAANRAAGHGQARGKPGFTGRTQVDRAKRAGYPHSGVSENVTAGPRDSREAVDNLMSAIYHRFGFLAFGMDEVGYGFNRRKGRERFVFNMGHSGLKILCERPPAEALFKPPGTFTTPCANRTRIRVEYFQRLTRRTLEAAPQVVVWPPRGGAGLPPAFYEESPDPLPDLNMSGYPVSVQFNPLFVKSARARSFRLFRHDGPVVDGRIDSARLRELKKTRLLTEQTDPNRKFSGLEFALFPLERLGWNQTYVAEAVFGVDGKEERLRWHFTTRDPGAPIYALDGAGEVLPVRAGKDYVIYLEPGRGDRQIGTFSYRASKGVRIATEPIDGNTLKVRLTGAVCETAAFTFKGGRFELRIADKDNIGRTHPASVLFAACPEYAADYKITGKNELLPVLSGKEYLIYFPPSKRHPRLGGYSARTNRGGIKMRIRFGLPNTLKVRITGPECGLVTVRLNDGRSFRLQLAEKDAAGKAGTPSRLAAGC